MKLSFLALWLALSFSCHHAPTPQPPPPPGPPSVEPTFCIAPTLRDSTTNAPIAGADIYISTLHAVSNTDGYAYLEPIPFPNELDIYAAGYQPFKQLVDVNSWSCDYAVGLTPTRGPRPTRAQTMNIKGNFLSMHDGQGRLMFSWFYPVLSPADRAVWRQAYAAAGVTHVVLDFNICYPNYWAPCVDNRATPGVIVQAVSELLNNGFIPIIMMTNGDGGTNVEVDQFWSSYVQTFNALEPCVFGNAGDPCAIIVPGFELVGPGGGWNSSMLSHALLVGHQLAPNAIWGVEFMPERFTGSSNPVESDDPWHGDEAGFWTSHGGENLSVFLYEAPHGSKLLDPNGASGAFCHLPGASPCGAWEDRWTEGLQRLCTGGLGWRAVPCSFFEVTGSDYKGGGVSDATVLRINNRALALCNLYGAACTFANGVPTGPQ